MITFFILKIIMEDIIDENQWLNMITFIFTFKELLSLKFYFECLLCVLFLRVILKTFKAVKLSLWRTDNIYKRK